MFRRSIPTVAEMWRVAVVLDDTAGAGRSELRRFKRDIAHEIQDRTGGTVVVAGALASGRIAGLGTWLTSGQSPVSAYTDNRAAAETAAQAAREVTGQHGPAARVSVECWHPAKGRWEDASAVSGRDLAEEHDQQQREDRRRSAETGIAQWRVRVELRNHRDTVTLAQRLSGDGIKPPGPGSLWWPMPRVKMTRTGWRKRSGSTRPPALRSTPNGRTPPLLRGRIRRAARWISQAGDGRTLRRPVAC